VIISGEKIKNNGKVCELFVDFRRPVTVSGKTYCAVFSFLLA
jgi:hypothetical protein